MKIETGLPRDSSCLRKCLTRLILDERMPEWMRSFLLAFEIWDVRWNFSGGCFLHPCFSDCFVDTRIIPSRLVEDHPLV